MVTSSIIFLESKKPMQKKKIFKDELTLMTSGHAQCGDLEEKKKDTFSKQTRQEGEGKSTSSKVSNVVRAVKQTNNTLMHIRQ